MAVPVLNCPICGGAPIYRTYTDIIRCEIRHVFMCREDDLLVNMNDFSEAVVHWNELVRSLLPKPDEEVIWNIKEDFTGE